MRITFIGTGTSQGVPVITCQCEVCTSPDPRDQRLRSSLLIDNGELTLVIDTGPDFRQQMLREKVMHLDAVLLTHGHKDHIGGLDDIRAFNFTQRKAIDVYASTDVHDSLEREFSYAFAKNKYPGVPEINLHAVSDQPFFIQSQKIIPVSVMHYHLPVLGFRINDLVYITDASLIETKELLKIKGCDTLIINGLRKKKHYSHFNLEEALEVIKEVGPKRAFITHISHMMGLHAEVEKELPEKVHLAYDQQQIVL
ncbi:MAG: MBL fold metallo-hydrolase [Bacteroidales bacterium]